MKNIIFRRNRKPENMDSRKAFILRCPVQQLDEYFDDSTGIIIHNGEVVGIEYQED